MKTIDKLVLTFVLFIGCTFQVTYILKSSAQEQPKTKTKTEAPVEQQKQISTQDLINAYDKLLFQIDKVDSLITFKLDSINVSKINDTIK